MHICLNHKRGPIWYSYFSLAFCVRSGHTVIQLRKRACVRRYGTRNGYLSQEKREIILIPNTRQDSKTKVQ